MKFIFIIICFFLIHPISGRSIIQHPEDERNTFEVIVIKGDCFFVNNRELIPIKTEDMVLLNSSPLLTENAYLGLLDTGGRTYGFKSRGENTSQNLINKPASRSGIKLCIPKACKFYNPELIISWWGIGDSIEYMVNIKNMDGNIIRKEIVTKPYIQLNFDDPQFKKERLLIFSVMDLHADSICSEEHGLLRMGEEQKENIANQLEKLEMTDDVDSADVMLRYATFFEERNLIIDALTCHLKAIEMDPEEEIYRKALNFFLLRNGLGK